MCIVLVLIMVDGIVGGVCVGVGDLITTSTFMKKITYRQTRIHSYEIFCASTRKRCSFNTGDCLIEVTAWAGLTIMTNEKKV